MNSVSDSKEAGKKAKKSNENEEEDFITHKTNDSAEGNNSTITTEAKTTDPHNDIDKTLPTSITPSSPGRERPVAGCFVNIDTDTKQIFIVIKQIHDHFLN